LLNGVYINEAEFIKENNQLKATIEKFWNCFKDAIRVNKCGLDGKQRIFQLLLKILDIGIYKKKLQICFEYNNVISYFIKKR